MGVGTPHHPLLSKTALPGQDFGGKPAVFHIRELRLGCAQRGLSNCPKSQELTLRGGAWDPHHPPEKKHPSLNGLFGGKPAGFGIGEPRPSCMRGGVWYKVAPNSKKSPQKVGLGTPHQPSGEKPAPPRAGFWGGNQLVLASGSRGSAAHGGWDKIAQNPKNSPRKVGSGGGGPTAKPRSNN